MADTGSTFSMSSSAKRSYLVAGVVAAVVSAGTVAYVFWSRSHRLSPQVESVQQLLERCHDQVRSIEHRLSELNSTATG